MVSPLPRHVLRYRQGGLANRRYVLASTFSVAVLPPIQPMK